MTGNNHRKYTNMQSTLVTVTGNDRKEYLQLKHREIYREQRKSAFCWYQH